MDQTPTNNPQITLLETSTLVGDFAQFSMQYLNRSNQDAIYSQAIIGCSEHDLKNDPYEFIGRYMSTVQAIVGIQPVMRFFMFGSDGAETKLNTQGMLVLAGSDWVAIRRNNSVWFERGWDSDILEKIKELEINPAQAFILICGDITLLSRGVIEPLVLKEKVKDISWVAFRDIVNHLTRSEEINKRGRIRTFAESSQPESSEGAVLEEEYKKIEKEIVKRIGVGY